MQITHDRLTKALDLVLSNAVVLYHDNTASVCGDWRSSSGAEHASLGPLERHRGPV